MKKLLTLIVVVAMLSAGAAADDSKIAPELRGISSTTSVRVIVQYASSSTTSTTSSTSSGGLLQPVTSLVSNTVGLVVNVLQALPLINGVVTVLTGKDIVNLSNQSNVVYISSDRPLANLLSNAAPAINASAAWNSGYTGSGIGIALIDSGISSVADLRGGLLN